MPDAPQATNAWLHWIIPTLTLTKPASAPTNGPCQGVYVQRSLLGSREQFRLHVTNVSPTVGESREHA
jgi:hypothetical protein